jgi:hypothetical protein
MHSLKIESSFLFQLKNHGGSLVVLGSDIFRVFRLEKKIEYCKQILALCELLEPGISTQRGTPSYNVNTRENQKEV